MNDYSLYAESEAEAREDWRNEFGLQTRMERLGVTAADLDDQRRERGPDPENDDPDDDRGAA